MCLYTPFAFKLQQPLEVCWRRHPASATDHGCAQTATRVEYRLHNLYTPLPKMHPAINCQTAAHGSCQGVFLECSLS